MHMMNLNYASLNTNDWIKMNTILETIAAYESISEFCCAFLEILRDIIPFTNGHFIFYDHNNHILKPVSYRLNITEKSHNEYLQYYHKIDDLFLKAFNTPVPKRSTDIMNYNSWKKTEFFNDFQLKNRYYYVALCDVHFIGKLISSISLIRHKKSPDFRVKELIFLKLLSPHIGNHLHKLAVIDALKSSNAKRFSDIIESNQRKYNLSRRESDIVNLIFKGFSNADISDELFISVDTVKKHTNNIFKKTLVSNRTELITFLLDI